MPNQIALLERFWTDECNIVGPQYVRILVEQASSGVSRIDDILEETEGDHAYGIVEAAEQVLQAALFITTCIQIKQQFDATKNNKDLVEVMLERLSPELDKKSAEEAAREIASSDK